MIFNDDDTGLAHTSVVHPPTRVGNPWMRFAHEPERCHDLANVLATSRGPLWIDWEDCFAGPLEWDLACLVKSGRLTGRGADRAEAALAAHGGGYEDGLLGLMIDARALQSDAWGRLFRAV